MRILLVEDEEKLANAVKRALEIKRFAVTVAYTGKLGMDLAVGEEFDLIILDIMLPEIDGIAICKQVRKENIHTPILMLTAKVQITDKVRGLDTGADDYMIKPFSFDEFFARIRALIRRPQKTNKASLVIKDLMLDTITFKVKRGSKPIKLSSKEFAILEYLIRYKNTVITKNQLVSHIWDYDANVLPNVVEVHIKHLRDKIDTGFPTNLIKTVRGKGYLIDDEY